MSTTDYKAARARVRHYLAIVAEFAGPEQVELTSAQSGGKVHSLWWEDVRLLVKAADKSKLSKALAEVERLRAEVERQHLEIVQLRESLPTLEQLGHQSRVATLIRETYLLVPGQPQAGTPGGEVDQITKLKLIAGFVKQAVAQREHEDKPVPDVFTETLRSLFESVFPADIVSGLPGWGKGKKT